MEELETKWEIVPQFIQVEAHPYFTQKELRVTLDKYGIKLMSWYPLGHGDTALMNELVFAGLGKNMENTCTGYSPLAYSDGICCNSWK